MVLDVKSEFERVAAALGPAASASQLLIAASTAAEQRCLEASTRRALLQETPSPSSSSPLSSASSLSSMLGGIDLGNLFGSLDIGGGGALSRSGSGSSLGSRGSLGNLSGGGGGSPGSGNGSSGGAARSPGSTSGGGGGSGSRHAFLATRSVGEVGRWLLNHLSEDPSDPSKLKWLTKMAGDLTSAGVVEVLDRCDRSNERTRTNNGEDRSPGGVFSKEAKRYLAERKRAAASLVAASAPPPAAPPPLRSYQRDVVGLVSLSWGLPLTPDVTADGGGGRAMQLFRSYDNWPGNWLVCAPTGSGKTRIFAEVIRACVENRRPGAGYLALVLVPRVLLTEQHESFLADVGLRARGVQLASHCGDTNPLTRNAWAALRALKAGGGAAAVVVTAASVLNLLNAPGVVEAGDVDLLVLDEAHHCQEDHPYRHVADRLMQAARSGGARLRVLAVSASPADDESEYGLKLKMTDLKSRLNARLHVVPEDAPEVAAVLASARKVEVHVGMRRVDMALMENMRALTIEVTLDLGDALEKAAPGAPPAAAAAIQQVLQALLQAAVLRSDGQYDESTFGAWLKNCSELAEKERCAHLQRACKLLDVMRKATWLVEDGGFEGALPYLARKAAALRQEEADEAGGSGGGGWDVGLRVSELVRRVLEDPVSSLLAGLGAGAREVVRDCFASGQLKERTFPKFWALLEYLEQYKGHSKRDSLRGMVFVRTRQAMYHVADMIRRSSQLSFFEVLEVTGHAAAAKSRAFRGAGDRHGRGMSDSEQRRVLRMFKAGGGRADASGGAKLLVATSAPEEGVDVPSCEFVVRYNAAATGIQLLQSMGRARQRVSEFVAILQDNTLDRRLHRSSQARVQNLRQYMRDNTPSPSPLVLA
ncbi:hypothetical protein HYH03_011295 [Edaphochlamys debaryana]|uniref:Uncharacterized protein n=1 Tax=Edaphochlamys debaryana TaxID=47281 RepID=A0A836BV80_9CHLO|nr:hypothetical protein HYH03_011295 [Edaphochlamys debaryana]|eukprot:KAG2490165.1 hypothetical protein HYH03_011295 [Edaphochlamys debaryana]